MTWRLWAQSMYAGWGIERHISFSFNNVFLSNSSSMFINVFFFLSLSSGCLKEIVSKVDVCYFAYIYYIILSRL